MGFNLNKKNKKKQKSLMVIVLGILFFICFVFFSYSVYAAAVPTSGPSSDSSGLLTGASNLASGAVSFILGAIAYVLTAVIGLLITLLIKVLMYLASYSDFTNAGPVVQGWVIIRDICNMFFVLVLLVIAFGSILRMENYSVKRLLPKLIIMAVLINFSKTIFGLIIDFAQVFMMTFVNAFGNGSYFIEIFRVQDWYKVTSSVGSADPLTGWATVTAIIMGVVAAIITFIVIAVLVVVLLMRIILIWIYVVLSPLYFLGQAVPGLQSYTSRIWSDFIKQVVTGPVLAFFIWLALSTLQSSQSGGKSTICPSSSTFFCDVNFQSFILAIGFLMGGLMMAQQAGGAGAKAASWGMGKVNQMGNIAKKGAMAPLNIPKEYAKRAGYGIGDRVLETMKDAPIVGRAAIKAQANLRMKREYAEDKETRYMRYLSDDDLDRIRRTYTGEGRSRVGRGFSALSRGMESSRQDYKRALQEKMSRGEQFGNAALGITANNDITRIVRDSMRMAGHNVTADGDNIYRDTDFGKKIDDFVKKRFAQLNPGTGPGSYGEYMSQFDGNVNAASIVAYQQKYTDPVNGHMPTLSETEMRNLVGGALRANDAAGTPFAALQWMMAHGKQKVIARVLDLEKGSKSNAVLDWAEANAIDIGANRVTPAIAAAYPVINANASARQGGDLGNSYIAKGKAKYATAVGEITGLDKLNRGSLVVNFSDLGLDPRAIGKHFEGQEKEEVARRIGDLLRGNGLAESVAGSIEEQLKQASHLILHNREFGTDLTERKRVHAHESIHAKLGQTFDMSELRTAWNAMGQEERKNAASKVSARWGAGLSEDQIMHEYFAEGLTNRTKYADKDHDAINLSSKANEELEKLMRTKNMDIREFVTGLSRVRPTNDEVKQTLDAKVNPIYSESMKELTDIISNFGNGMSALGRVASSVDTLEKGLYRNNMLLEKKLEAMHDNTRQLEALSSKVK